MIFRASLLAMALGSSALAQDGIEVQSLDALDPMEVGLPGAVFDMTLWDGTSAMLARTALSQLPGAQAPAYPSLALSEMARAILASGGYPPSGGRGVGDLAALRADRLLAASGAYDAFDLLERTPSLTDNQQMARMHADLGFVTGSPERSCYTARSLTEGRDSAYWVRVRALCLALDGQNSAAELTAELAGSIEPDADFDRLLFALTLGQPLGDDVPAVDSALDVGLMRALSGGMLGELDFAETAPAWIERAVGEPRLPNFLQSQDPQADLARAAELEGMERRIALISVIAQGMDGDAAATALNQLIEDEAQAGDLLGGMRRYGSDVSSLPITAQSLAHGQRFALSAVLVGDARTARRWLDGLVDGPERQPLDTGLEPLKTGAAETTAENEWQPASADQIVTVQLALALAEDRIDSFAAYRFLYERLLGAAVRPWLPSAFCAAASLPTLHPDRRRILLQSISESAATAAGWSTREPVFWPEWVEKVDAAAAA